MYPMNKLISAAFGMFTVLATCVSSNLSAATPDWENPEVFAEGREPVRATAFPYPSKAEALRGDYQSSPWFKNHSQSCPCLTQSKGFKSLRKKNPSSPRQPQKIRQRDPPG